MTEEDYIKKQIELNSNIRCENTVNLSQVQTVAGVDLAYWKEEEQEYAVCCIVIINYNTFEVIERVSYADKIKVPYIPVAWHFVKFRCFWKPTKKVR